MTYPNDAPGDAGTFAAPPPQTYPGQLATPPVPAVLPESIRYRSGGREPKTAFLTTEFWAYIAAVIAVVATSFYFSEDNGQPDEFTADQALRYITWLTIGYMVARGLAKAGRRHLGDPDDY